MIYLLALPVLALIAAIIFAGTAALVRLCNPRMRWW